MWILSDFMGLLKEKYYGQTGMDLSAFLTGIGVSLLLIGIVQPDIRLVGIGSLLCIVAIFVGAYFYLRGLAKDLDKNFSTIESMIKKKK